jgi:hypothetical protein
VSPRRRAKGEAAEAVVVQRWAGPAPILLKIHFSTVFMSRLLQRYQVAIER